MQQRVVTPISRWWPPASAVNRREDSVGPGSELAEADAGDGVIWALLEDEMGALARRQDVLAKVDRVDGRPDAACRLDRFFRRQRGIPVEI